MDKSVERKLNYYKIFGRTLSSSFLSVTAIISTFLETPGVGIFSNYSLHYISGLVKIYGVLCIPGFTSHSHEGITGYLKTYWMFRE